MIQLIIQKKLEYLIEHLELWPEMSRYGKIFVEERYDIKKLNQRLVRIYEALIIGNTNALEKLRKSP